MKGGTSDLLSSGPPPTLHPPHPFISTFSSRVCSFTSASSGHQHCTFIPLPRPCSYTDVMHRPFSTPILPISLLVPSPSFPYSPSMWIQGAAFPRAAPAHDADIIPACSADSRHDMFKKGCMPSHSSASCLA